MIRGRVGLSHRNGLPSAGKAGQLSYFARGSKESGSVLAGRWVTAAFVRRSIGGAGGGPAPPGTTARTGPSCSPAVLDALYAYTVKRARIVARANTVGLFLLATSP